MQPFFSWSEYHWHVEYDLQWHEQYTAMHSFSWQTLSWFSELSFLCAFYDPQCYDCPCASHPPPAHTELVLSRDSLSAGPAHQQMAGDQPTWFMDPLQAARTHKKFHNTQYHATYFPYFTWFKLLESSQILAIA